MQNSSLYLKPVTAVLGPTNTGKTHYAITRMASYETGMIGLPLRLLAREVFDRLVEMKGARKVALVTGEEKIIPKNACYFVCTVEAMPLERQVAFMAIDEVQLAADPERGRVFTERLLYARGTAETLFLGADTMRPLLQRLIPDIGFITRERFSKLEYSGLRKITRLPRRSAIVAFSADAVYAIAELIRRQRGGAAIIMGALSPRTRNAQAALYQSGEVDYLVATDAIGMGLNMDIDHVAFAALGKFDGRQRRALLPAELAQIGGRAGRHVKDGTFGVTGDCAPLSEEIVDAIEAHEFEPVTALQWRSVSLDFNSLPALQHSLGTKPPRQGLVRARGDADEEALYRLCQIAEIKRKASGGAALRLLWDVCQIPDFRKTAIEQHIQLLQEIYLQIIDDSKVREAWLAPQINRLDRMDGDVDALSQRIAYIRTWTYLTHRTGWVENAAYWQERARSIEDKLSDALHQSLSQRFIDRRSSLLMRKLKDETPLLGGVDKDGDVIVEGEFVGRLQGFQFILDPTAKGPHARAVRYAAMQALKPELATRAARLGSAKDDGLVLRDDGTIWWQQASVAKLYKGATPFRPEIRLLIAETLPPQAIEAVRERIELWFGDQLRERLMPLLSLNEMVNRPSTDDANSLGPGARGIGYRLVENFGACSRALIADDVKALEQNERGKLRKLGVRFGEYTIFQPALLKPANAKMLTLLWALWQDKAPQSFEPPKAGLTSVALNNDYPHAYYYASGYRPSGTRAVRIDMLERLAELIRKARMASPHKEGFIADAQMMSLVGCSGEDFEGILKSLSLRKNIVTLEKQVFEKRLERKAQELAEAQSKKAETARGEKTSQEKEAGKEQPVAKPSDNNKADAQTDDKPEPLTKKATENIAADMAKDKATAENTEENKTKEDAGKETISEPAPVEAIGDSKEKATETSSEPAKKQEDEKIELTLWRMAPRFAKPRHKPSRKPADGQHARGKKPFNKKGKPGQRKGGSQGKQAMRTYTAAPSHKKGKQIDPDSPFAVLAGLKDKD